MKKKTYKILYLHHTGNFGGGENSLLHLVAHLDKSIFKPVFLCPTIGEFSNRLKQQGIKVIPGEFGRFRDAIEVIKSVKKICNVALAKEVDLLHSNDPHTNIPSGLSGIIIRKPVIWHERNLLKKDMIDVDRIAGFLPNKIICNSEAIRSRFSGKLLQNKSVTIMNSVDLKDFDVTVAQTDVRKSLGIPENAQVVGMSSRLGNDKGHLTLLRAVSRLIKNFPDLWVLIIGGHVFPEDSWVPNFLKKNAMNWESMIR